MFFRRRILGPTSLPLMTGETEVFAPHGSEIYTSEDDRSVNMIEVS